MSPSSSSSSSSEDRGTIRAADILMFAWKGRAQLLGLAVAGALLGGVGSLLAPKKYETHTSFVSVGSSSIRLPSGLAGLAGAAQSAGLAISLGGGESQQLSPYFFGDLVTSDALLMQLAVAPFPQPNTADGRSAPLGELLREAVQHLR